MKFTKFEKIILLQEIKNRPVIWNSQSKGYYSVQKLENAWKEISQILNKSELECKKCFQSLRSSQRYQRNKQLKLQERQQKDNRFKKFKQNEQWEMEKYLNFLQENSPNKKMSASSTSTLTIAENVSDHVKPVQIFKATQPMTSDTIEAFNVENNNGVVYSYVATSDSLNDHPVEDNTGSSSLLNDIWNTSSVDDQYPNSEVLKYDGMLRNIDWLLQKLPETEVIDLNMQFIQLIYDKFKQNGDTIIKPETIC